MGGAQFVGTCLKYSASALNELVVLLVWLQKRLDESDRELIFMRKNKLRSSNCVISAAVKVQKSQARARAILLLCLILA